MSLHPTMKRRLHERLHPLIGEEEADALLDELSPPAPVTREWLEERFATKEWIEERFATKEWIDVRFESFVTRDHFDWRLAALVTTEELDLKLESMENRMSSRLDRGLRQQTIFTGAFLGGAATIISIVQAIWG